ncbi:hypothetical protein KCP71_18220 [Salmonella enterica subsp. enterica]|nr:hypothetical protein KCP71_18220 [Salmonella enterica subsp. enterica]
MLVQEPDGIKQAGKGSSSIMSELQTQCLTSRKKFDCSRDTHCTHRRAPRLRQERACQRSVSRQKQAVGIITDQVRSLDPHKIEGVPESNVSRDLFVKAY